MVVRVFCPEVAEVAWRMIDGVLRLFLSHKVLCFRGAPLLFSPKRKNNLTDKKFPYLFKKISTTHSNFKFIFSPSFPHCKLGKSYVTDGIAQCLPFFPSLLVS